MSHLRFLLAILHPNVYNSTIVLNADQDNIRARPPADVMWDETDPLQSLREVRKAAEEECQKTIDWYWHSKRWKARLSRMIQLMALVLTAAAGIVPVVIQVTRSISPAKPGTPIFDSGPLAALFVGIAASLLGLDKAFGFSSGWTRYVLTATTMTKLLHEFRLDWVALSAGTSSPPTVEEQEKLIQRAKDLVSTIQSMVVQETKDWATEFQSNMAQMEKDLKTQLDTLKAQVDKTEKDKEAAGKPGAIELTVTNADKTDGFQFEVTLEGDSGKLSDSIANSKVWTHINVKPGQYKLKVDAKAKGAPTGTAGVVEVKPGETEKPQLAFPIA